MLGAQAAHQVSEHHAQLAGEACGVNVRCHGPHTIYEIGRETAQFSCIINI